MLPVIHGFWLGYVRTVTVGDNVIDTLIEEANDRCGALLNAIGGIHEYNLVCASKAVL
jgi:hypothetical protein